MAVTLLMVVDAPAQNPSADQYTPVAPSGGGPAPLVGGSSGGGGSAAAASPALGETSELPGAQAGLEAAGEADAGRVGGQGRNGLAPGGGQAVFDEGIVAAGGQSGSGDQSAASLVRAAGGDPGMGGFFWVLLGASLVWAAVLGVRRHHGDRIPRE
ncbi:MAG: hypothetical protein EDQ89_00450 [Acidobacteria bacterium]|nr:MAG: hypothetical protein EDQ89_00450 [Acidobacteriota bacterium]GIK76704.1 MAG: hypothetical protein BroJett022_03940 [Actinomycetes bacterium]